MTKANTSKSVKNLLMLPVCWTKINNNNYEVMHVYISFVDEDNQMSSENF